MKKKIATCLLALSLTGVLYADSGTYGTIVDINDAAKTILVETTYGQRINVKILPNTEIDMEDCGIFGTDKQGTFSDLQVGTFIKAKTFYGYGYDANQQQNPQQIQNATAREIEIECKKRAY
ncbi:MULTISPECIES: hypothetical protein [unclassified Campylobacter]|uniref:hypothetical protein n=1 Tax=unclassified Campylobacter TaxID=2593542 RepID=UPI00123826A9|nr:MULTISPECIES: hypothetical protein [unclassified Campylobacter]KAA6227216.1 hypothetical protein FMM57_04570 [Campylobacter sp. LR286c]KAA6227910.1 hypothetical protein FMM54_01905 [Campylobacter sp. LR185c]KAA6228319.1 hypothetical protein FMM55_01715 [Campylobacter sp. LR196d]KAA6229320.1 hypothetical protein FMM58_08150 [Campylobacter sp. LR291e]KAA6231126.1 hypothetical protein FMM56_05415 [Campylobacter sp. LR264d]